MCTQSASAQPCCDIDNDRVRVTRWTFAPGAETGHHRHEYDYVICPITDGRMRIDDADGARVVELSAGVSYFRAAGIEHNVTNLGDDLLIFVETELK